MRKWLNGWLLTIVALTVMPSALGKSLAPELLDQKKSHPITAGAETQVLKYDSAVIVDEQGLATTQVYVSIAITDADAVRDYSQIEIPYNTFYETLSLDFARVLTPEGQLENVSKDAVQEQSPSQENFYQDRKILTFSLPNIRPGAFIEFQYTRTDIKAIVPKVYFGNVWFNWWQERAGNMGSRFDQVLSLHASVALPKNSHLLTHQSLKMPKVKASQKNTSTHIIYQWTAENIPAVKWQPFTPTDQELIPVITISTAQSWPQIVSWAMDLFSSKILANTAIKEQAKKIAAQNTTTEAKIKAVYQFVNEHVRYVFAHVGRGGYEPHVAEAVLASGYGDCKDQTVLTVTLLRELGIEAHPALVATKSMGKPAFGVPSIYFDHMITYIPAQNAAPAIWMDTTGENTLYPGFSMGIEGQPALVISPVTQGITYIPNLPAKEHFAYLELTYLPQDNGQLFADFTLKLGGVYEQNLRALWLYQPEKEKVMAEALGSMYNNAKLKNLSALNSNSLWQPFELSGRWVFESKLQMNEANTLVFNMAQMMSVFASIYQWHAPAERKQAFQLDPGYTLKAHIIFKSTPNAIPNEMQSVGPNIKNAWFNIVQKSQKQGGDYVVDASLNVERQTVPLEQYAAFHHAFESLSKEHGFSVIYTPPVHKTNGATINTNIADNNFVLIRSALAKSQFKQALNLAEQAVKTSPKNGEAYYLLGLSQGYNNLLIESAESFKRANELGFKQP